MPSTSLLLLIACSIVLCTAQTGWQFSGNLSKSAIKNNQWDYKTTIAVGINLPLLGLIGGSFLAGEVSGNQQSGKVDIVFGSGYVALNGFPFSYLAFYEAMYNVNVSGQGAVTADVSAAAGYMGHACLWLEERDPAGNVVTRKTLQWQGNLLNDEGFTYSLTETSKPLEDIQFVTFSGKSNNEATPNFNVTITYMSTSVAGIVKGTAIEDIKMIPGSIESIIGINNYPYASTSNALTLVMAVATGAATVSASGQTLYSPDGSVYFSMAKQAYVGGKRVDVGITAFEVGNFSAVSNNDLHSQVTGKYGAAASVKFVSVSFPAGAAHIAYDPAIGQGTPATEGAASTGAVASLVLIAIAVIVSMF